MIDDDGDENNIDNQSDRMETLVPDAVPLHSDVYVDYPPRRPISKLCCCGRRKKVVALRFTKHTFPIEYDDHDASDFRRADTSIKILRDLKKGYWPITRKIDLHGCTCIQARNALERFFDQAVLEEHRCVLIIHGRGRGGHAPLRAIVRYGLRMNSHSVLAFCAAPRTQGGDGATLVLLKKP